MTQWCRLKVKVTIEGHLSLVHSITSEPFERFSWNFGQMFALVSRCAKPITEACWLKIKVTVKGHEFESWISCRLHISWTLWKIFIRFGSNVCLSEMMCRTHTSTMQTHGQGHNWRPPVWALNFDVAPLSFCGGGYSCPSDCLVNLKNNKKKIKTLSGTGLKRLCWMANHVDPDQTVRANCSGPFD